MAETLDRSARPDIVIKHVHVVGGGLAGLSAAMELVEAGVRVTLYEAGPAAGGRCRSYFDRELGVRLDNGNHLLLSGNRDAFAYLDRIGTRDTMAGPTEPVFPFIDVSTGERWTVRPNRGRVPWWVLSRRRRVPGARLGHFIAASRLSHSAPNATVAERLPSGELYRRLLEPLAIAALNTLPATASARLLGAVMDESLSRGGAACVPAYPAVGLSESFIDPAIQWLEARGAMVRLGSRVARLGFGEARVTELDGTALGLDEGVVLATPALVAASLMPGLTTPDRFEAILNVHFRCEADPGEAGFFGLLGGTAEWIFMKPGVVSSTISAGNARIGLPSEDLAQQVWHDICVVRDIHEPMPAYRVVREKRATFAATPEQDRRRPQIQTPFRNLVLAGDWTATGLPATIEGAIRSGRSAAKSIR